MDFLGQEKQAKARTARKVSSSSVDPQEMKTGKISSSGFKLFTFDTKGLEVTLANFVHSTSLLPNFLEGDIKIFHQTGFDMKNPDFGILMANERNKPFDVLVFMHALTTNQYDGNESMFKFHIHEAIDQAIFVKNTTLLVFAYLLYMTRGNLPRQGSTSSSNPLPKLLRDTVGDKELLTEQNFAEQSASFDLGKLDARFFLKMDVNNLPEQIVNRIRKGSAGSRSLKFFKLVLDYPEKERNDFSLEEQAIIRVLYDVVSVSQSYLNLHPANQIVQAQVKDFYPSVISLGARLIGEANWPSFLASVRQIPTFDKDKVLQSLSLRNGEVYINASKFEHGFKSISPAKLEELFGKPY